MDESNEDNKTKQSNKSIIVMVFDDCWIVNGLRLKREHICENEQIRLLKSILARKPVKISLEINNNIRTRYDKKEQIHLLKSMMIKRTYGFPIICIDSIEQPEDMLE